MKKRLSVTAAMLAVFMLVCTLVGCKPDSQESKPSAAGTGRVYYLNFKPEQAKAWERLAKEYTDKTGIEVTVVTAASDEYETTLKSEIAKTDAPTLFQVNGPIGLKAWHNYCYDLTDTEIYKRLKSDDFALKGENGEVLAVAYVIETYGIICNKTILEKYCKTDGAVISSPSEITSFDTLKAVAEDIGQKKAELGVAGAFTSAGMDSSSDWRFKSHLANIPIYYEYKDRGISETDAIRGDYLDNYKAIWDLYINNATCSPAMISSKTGEDALSEFALGEAVFYQNGTWSYGDIVSEGIVTDDDLWMLPVYIGVPGEESQGLCTGSENYWCINKQSSADDIKATEDFLEWVITSDEGRGALSRDMNFVTPFETFTDEWGADNPLVDIADKYIEEGKTPVSWNFSTIPSEKWKNGVGSALLEYAQGTGDWDKVKDAYIKGWAEEYAHISSRAR